MNRYIIESPHSELDCQHALSQVNTMGFILHYEWGCKDGNHTGWAIIESDSPEEALLTVPSFIRHRAKVTKLSNYTPEDFSENHK